MTIHETCSCGATLDFSSDRSVAGLDVAHVQAKFHKLHAKCGLPQQDTRSTTKAKKRVLKNAKGEGKR